MLVTFPDSLRRSGSTEHPQPERRVWTDRDAELPALYKVVGSRRASARPCGSCRFTQRGSQPVAQLALSFLHVGHWTVSL